MVLSETEMSLSEFEPWWSQKVADEFGLDYDTILGLYDRSTDVHQTERGMRAIWKYGAAKGVSGTPTAFINGVKLDSFPSSTQEWLDLLNGVYASQWHGNQASFNVDQFLH